MKELPKVEHFGNVLKIFSIICNRYLNDVTNFNEFKRNLICLDRIAKHNNINFYINLLDKNRTIKNIIQIIDYCNINKRPKIIYKLFNEIESKYINYLD